MNPFKILILLLTGLFFVSGLKGQEKLIEEARILYESKKYPEAIAIYEKALAKNEKKSKLGEGIVLESQLNLARAYKFSGNSILSEEQYKDLMEDYGDDAKVLFEYGRILQNNHKYKRAEKIFETLGELYPSDSLAGPFSQVCKDVITQNYESEAYQILKLRINTQYSDFGPAFYKKSLVFASTRDMPKNDGLNVDYLGEGYSDIFVAKGDKTGYYSTVEKFEEGKINTKVNEGSPCFSSDFETLYFSRNYFVDGKLSTSGEDINKLVILKADYDEGEWGNIEVLPFNNPEFNCTHPSISRDGKYLYFASDMPGGQGGMDIFRVENNGGGWGEPENLGPVINSTGNEMFPFIHDDTTLYFSSDGHVGVGGLDLFKSKISENGEYLEPENLKQPLNSAKDDFSMILNKERDVGFMTSNRDGDDNILLIQRKGTDNKEELPEVVDLADSAAIADSIAAREDSIARAEAGIPGYEGEGDPNDLGGPVNNPPFDLNSLGTVGVEIPLWLRQRTIPELIFSVQIGYYKNNVKQMYLAMVAAFPSDLRIVKHQGHDRYLVGRFMSYGEADDAKDVLKTMYDDSFIQVYYRGELIDIRQAFELLNQE